MAVTWRIPDVLRRYAREEQAVDVDGETVGAALEQLLERHPALRARVLDDAGRLFGHLVVFRNDDALPRDAALTAPVADRDVLDLVSPASGG